MESITKHNISFSAADIVVFDLCGTIYDSNTTFDFLDFYFRNNGKYQQFRKLRKILPVKALNKISTKLFHYDFVRIIGVRFLQGMRKSDLQDALTAFNTSFLLPREIALTKSMLTQAKAANARIILLSASLDLIVERLAKNLEFPEFHSTTLTTSDGVYTGQINVDLLGQKEKFISKLQRNHRKVIFITDNVSDANVIPLVDEFHVVSPAKLLKYWKTVKGIKGLYEI